MTTKDEVLKLALEALKLADDLFECKYVSYEEYGLKTDNDVHIKYQEAIQACREALAQQEQEPVAWMYQNSNTDNKYLVWQRSAGGRNWQPLYTAAQPAPAVHPLKDDQIHELDWPADVGGFTEVEFIVRQVEAAHGIGAPKEDV